MTKQQESKPEASPNIHQRMLAVIADAGALEKTGKATFGGGYQFHAIDAVVDHLRPIFAKHGVLAVPTALAHEESQGTDKMPFRSMAALRVTFYNVDDPSQFINSEAWGEGLDNQDKACGKSYSYALKTILLGVCQLRGQPDNEDDDKGLESGRRIGKPRVTAPPARAPKYDLTPDEMDALDAWLADPRIKNKSELEGKLLHVRHSPEDAAQVKAALAYCREKFTEPREGVTA